VRIACHVVSVPELVKRTRSAGAHDPEVERLLDGALHRGVAVAHERGARGGVEVDVLLAIDVVETPALTAGGDERPAQCCVEAGRGGDAAGQVLLGDLVEALGLAHLCAPFRVTGA
jgi:hypothetical protein